MDSFKLSDRVTVFPIIHGSGDYSMEVRRFMLQHNFDALAVPLPPSFRGNIDKALKFLPQITLVTQRHESMFQTDWSPQEQGEDEDEQNPVATYVPVDPCQGVIMALRLAEQERMPCYYVDRESHDYEPLVSVYPDPYVLKRVNVEKFSAALLPQIPALSHFHRGRVSMMARQLQRLAKKHKKLLMICSLMEWPWLRQAYQQEWSLTQHDRVADTEIFQVSPATLTFVLGELPFITGLYERARQDIEDDDNLSIDGVKEMLLVARERYREDLGKRARKITPHLLRIYLKYVRNLSLMERRLTPDLYTLIQAAAQIMGDQFAQDLAEVSADYPYIENMGLEEFDMGIAEGKFSDGEIFQMHNRLPGSDIVWRTLKLKPKHEKMDFDKSQMNWNSMTQCSWPPEDKAVENFRNCVTERAMSLLGQDLSRSEKFTSSVKDGLDIRETLRNWHTGELYVKVIPPSIGQLDSVLMFFDSPADPREYPWRTTWMAENQNESTLSFYASDFHEEMVGPGIGLANYGGCLFLFPPRPIPDVWQDPRLVFTTTLEEKLLAAACIHSEENHIALLSVLPPGVGWRRLAKQYGKKLIHVPLAHFSASMIQQLRMVHVLNGHEIRSYASHFIRQA